MVEYRVGQKIEVIGKEEGFEGSYYAAKVISKEGANQYMVEYGTLLKEDESGPLQEVLVVDLLRPEPPNMANDAFSLEEVVDAYYNDGWWIGLIEGKFGSEYFVQFPHAGGEEVPFTIDKLRVHLDGLMASGDLVLLIRKG